VSFISSCLSSNSGFIWFDDIKDKNANPDINPIQDKTTEKQNRGKNTIKEKQEVSANANIEKQKPLSSSKQMENHKTVERQATGQQPTGSTPDTRYFYFM
jgi:hypothetical protein